MKRKFLKSIAAFLAINIFFNTIAPTISFALTSGPTAPEYTSFEPIDTTDMVNLATGDFTYNLPLLEVPGPEGGYPLALSYHAGISPNDESSWCGLGWNLNPGAINRFVNGIPDDMNGSEELVRDEWEGGSTKSTSVGIGIGWSSGGMNLGAGVGLSFTNDTYQGRGVGANFDFGVGSMGAKAGISGGVNSDGSNFIGLNGSMGGGNAIGKSSSSIGMSMSAGLTLTSGNSGSKLSASGGGGLGIGYTPKGRGNSIGTSILGAGISTESASPSFGIGGISMSSVNNLSNNITSSTSGISLNIPIWYGVNISFSRSTTRYYLDQIDNTKTFGSLYGRNIPTDFDNVSFDCYSMKGSASSYTTDADRETEGSLPAYDNYQVLGQGIAGSIQPYLFEQGSLFRKIQKDENGNPENGVAFDYHFNPFSSSIEKVGYRFVNDFSTSFTRSVATNYNSSNDYKNNLDAFIGIEGKDYSASDIKDFNKSTGMLAGSKHVEWFTNKEIEDAISPIATNGSEQSQLDGLSTLNGLVPDLENWKSYFTSHGQYGQDADDNIGAFLVTNESGVSYHYTIPVYNFNEISKYNSSTQGDYSRKITKGLPYAYTWLLTGITGPDYVDRAPYGIMDENDWGYWVKFEYGKWTDKYIWRNPAIGSEKDIDSGSEVVTTGRKELYYLDAIKTRSHTALFVKDIKRDGKGVGSQENGGFEVERGANNSVKNLPVASLKLNKILLFTNRVLEKQLESKFGSIHSVNELKSKGDALQQTYSSEGPNGTINVIFHNGKNVLDIDDLTKGGDITGSAVRQINFNHTYSLCPGVPNSFEMDYTNSTYTKSLLNNGKLTLESVEVKGLNGKKIIPPTSFEYALPNTPYAKDAQDVWGMYKSDYTQDETDRKKTPQITTNESASYVHAWSLNKIKTSIGADITIQYESDKIKKSVMSNLRNLNIKSMQKSGGGVYINLNSTENIGFWNELHAGKTINIKALFNTPVVNQTSGISLSQYPQEVRNSISNFSEHRLIDENAQILSVMYNQLYVNAPQLASQLEMDHVTYIYNNGTQDYTNNYEISSAFANGNVITDRNFTNEEPGGGIRVKSISMQADNVENITTYNYTNGTTSYEPIDLNLHVKSNLEEDLKNQYKNKIYNYYSVLLANTSFLPPPGVLYESVIVQDKVRQYSNAVNYTEIPGVASVKYEFSVFDNTMQPRYDGGTKALNEDGYNLHIVKMKDYRARVGLLKRITQYSGQNAAGTLLSRQENKYLHDDPSVTDYESELASNYKNQGRIDQVFFERKTVDGTNKKFLVTEIEEYPVIPIGQLYTDYKKNISEESKTLEFDYYSGEPLVSWSKDAYGNEFITQSIPAYTIPEYQAMGHKINNPSNKHMLTQNAASYAFKVVPNKSNPKVVPDYDKVGLLSANATTWGTGLKVLYPDKDNGIGIIYQNDIWRAIASYSWIGDDDKPLNEDGTHLISDFVSFNFGNYTLNNLWQKNGELTLCNVYSRPLEAKNLNDNYAATLLDPTESYIIATSVNARHDEIAYSGCEFNEYYTNNQDVTKRILEGNIKLGNGVIVQDKDRSHTGNYCLKVNTNQEGFNYTFQPQANKWYRASVWLYLPGSAEGSGNSLNDNAKLIYRVKGTTDILGEVVRDTKFKARSHYLLNLDINANSIPKVNGQIPEIEVVCISNNADRSIYFDDFRVHPLKAGFVSYVYDLDRSLVTHILNGENFYTRFEYDEMGNLIKTYQEIIKETESLVSEQKYNYGKSK